MVGNFTEVLKNKDPGKPNKTNKVKGKKYPRLVTRAKHQKQKDFNSMQREDTLPTRNNT